MTQTASQTIYIYSAETGEQIDSHEADDNAACEAWAAENYGDTDAFGWSYTPGGNPDIKAQYARETANAKYRIVVSESHSTTTTSYPFKGTEEQAIAEAKRHLGGCHIGEGWVRVDNSDDEPVKTLRA